MSRVGIGVHPSTAVLVEGGRNGVADADSAERDVAGCDRLGELHDVWLDVPVIQCEENTRPAEPGNYLVGD